MVEERSVLYTESKRSPTVLVPISKIKSNKEQYSKGFKGLLFNFSSSLSPTKGQTPPEGFFQVFYETCYGAL